MREIGTELKALKLYGMASAWGELSTSGNDVGIQSSRWLIEHLLQAEHEQRAFASVRHQMKANFCYLENLQYLHTGKFLLLLYLKQHQEDCYLAQKELAKLIDR